MPPFWSQAGDRCRSACPGLALALPLVPVEQVSFWNAATARPAYCFGSAPGGGVGGTLRRRRRAGPSPPGRVAAGAVGGRRRRGAPRPSGAGAHSRCRRGGSGRRRRGRLSATRTPPARRAWPTRTGSPDRWSRRRRRRAAGRRSAEHRAEAQLRGLPDGLGRVAVRARDRDHDPVRALGDHLGLGHTEPVDPVADDLTGLVERRVARRLAVGRSSPSG